MDGEISRILNKAYDGTIISDAELKRLFELEDWTEEAAEMRHVSRLFSRDCFGPCEVSCQIGLDNYPCAANCKFCSFAPCNHVFAKEDIGKLEHDDIVGRAQYGIEQGATSIFLMTTATYKFEELLEVGRKVRAGLGEDVPLVVNTADFDADQAVELKKAGFDGAYHVIRMGEERDNELTVAGRWKTIEGIKAAGMFVSTCVEPIGPEHSVDELVEKTVFTREMEAVHSGAMRRTTIPGSDLEKYGQISYARLANIVAAVNLGTGPKIANCTHNPNKLGPMAGANLFWAEAGRNPRDTDGETEGSEGQGVPECIEIFKEANCEVNTGTSNVFHITHNA